jgi:glutamate-1-semialdehyde 2,1-aminomutase
LGKVIGGGLPVGAYGGRRDVMELIAPSGPVYQAGTLSGNPLAMAAGIATLRGLQSPDVWEQLEERGQQLLTGLATAAKTANIPIHPNRVGAMCGFFFTAEPVINWQTARQADTQRYATFFQAMLANGVYLPPSQFEAWFLSTAHTPAEIEATIQAAARTFETVR